MRRRGKNGVSRRLEQGKKTVRIWKESPRPAGPPNAVQRSCLHHPSGDREPDNYLGTVSLSGMDIDTALIQFDDVEGQWQPNAITAGIANIGCAEKGLEDMTYLALRDADALVGDDEMDRGAAGSHG